MGLALTLAAASEKIETERPWCDSFSPDKSELSEAGKNPFFFLWPGYRLCLQHGKDQRLLSFLAETRVVDGVKTRVVETRETHDGKLTAVSREYCAISTITGDVYGFGKEQEIFINDKPVGRRQSWMAGVHGARLGLLMPGRPSLGDRYYHGTAPGVAMDRTEILGLAEDVTTPRRTFERCLRTRESCSLNNDVVERIYAPGVGLVKDGDFVLTKIGCPLCDGAP